MSSSAVLILISLTFVNLFGFSSTFTSDELRVTLSNGNKLIGEYFESFSGRIIKGFTGVPYAKPPVGPLRFKAPEPFGKWDDEFQAIEIGPSCPQRNLFNRSFEDTGDEDCLHMNIFVPYSFDEVKAHLPVLVYFHGGGFSCGSLNMVDPRYLLDQDVILVTANYRVGILGFLSTEEEHCPGNFGLKDQVMALQWVHDNIKQFGGDPKSVTIIGPSAGGASVTFLMASPLAKGLFSKGIAFSGTNLASWSMSVQKGVARRRAKKLASQFDCYKPNDWSQSIDCLRNVSAMNISAALYNFFEYDFDPMIAFPPVIEPKLPGAFITKHPRDMLLENSQKTPFLTGITYDEGLVKSAALFDVPGLFKNFTKNFNKALPIMLYYDHYNASVQDAITSKIKKFYFDDNVTRDKEKNITNLFGDALLLNAMDSYLRLRLAHNDTSPTYAYLFTNKGSISSSAKYSGDPDKYYGVSHGDEQIYLVLYRNGIAPTTLPTKEEVQMRKAMIQLVVDFARTGNPTPDSSYLPKWNQINHFPINYYRLGNLNFEGRPIIGMENEDGLFEDRAKFWRHLGLHSSLKYPSNEELNVLLKQQNSAIKTTTFTWIELIFYTLFSIFSMQKIF